MAKRKGKRRRPGFTLPIAVIGGIAGMPNLQGAVQAGITGDFPRVGRELGGIVGVQEGRFDFNLLLKNMVPLFAGGIVHWLAGKFGINRAIGRARIPIFRI